MSTQLTLFEADAMAGLWAMLVALLAILAILGVVANVASAWRRLEPAQNGPGRDVVPDRGLRLSRSVVSSGQLPRTVAAPRLRLPITER